MRPDKSMESNDGMKQDDSYGWDAYPGMSRHPRSSQRSDQQIVAELVKVLAAHPGGLRRWSVMRAIRNGRDRASLSLKFEAEVERIFKAASTGSDALFYKPEGKAGEVWALRADRAGIHLPASGETSSNNLSNSNLTDERRIPAAVGLRKR